MLQEPNLGPAQRTEIDIEPKIEPKTHRDRHRAKIEPKFEPKVDRDRHRAKIEPKVEKLVELSKIPPHIIRC